MSVERPQLTGHQSLDGLKRHVVACLDDAGLGFWYDDFSNRQVAEHLAERIREREVDVVDGSGDTRVPDRVVVFECLLEPNESIERGGE